MAIKLSIKKLILTSPLQQFMAKHLPLNMVQLLPITIDHLAAVAAFPLHHRDPFDRLMVAQAIVDDFDVISADPTLDAYLIRRHW